MKVAPLKLKVNNFFDKTKKFTKNDRVTFIYNDDKEFFKNVEKYGIILLN